MIRVVVADDQEIVRDGLTVLLGLLEGVQVVGEAADGEAAIREVALSRPDVVLMDLRMPILGGADATRRIVSDYPDISVLVLTTYADDASIADALRAGARGYLTKDAGRAQLEAAIRSVAAGQTALSAAVGDRLIDGLSYRLTNTASVESAGEPVADLRRRFPTLTQREAEVLALMIAGSTNPRIAARLFVAVPTVKTHINSLFSKLGTTSREETIALVRRSAE